MKHKSDKRIAVLISGGNLDESFITEQLEKRKPEILIGVDSGNQFLYEHQISPTHVVGDFDSLSPKIATYYKGQTEIPVQEYNPVKDASDTEIAVKLALDLDADEIILLGAIGTRMDHVLANIQLLRLIRETTGGKTTAKILDSNNRIRLIASGEKLKREDAYGSYFSLFSLWGDVQNLLITGAKYSLRNQLLKADNSLCVSNQFQDDMVEITFDADSILLMETRD